MRIIKSVGIPIVIGVFMILVTACTVPPELRKLPQRPVKSLPELSVSSVPRLGIPTYGHCIRVLSIDGGGIRGIIPAMILAEIEDRTGHSVAELFDLIVGTSTGSILALGLAKPHPKYPDIPHYTARELVVLYEKEGRKIFPAGVGIFKNLPTFFSPKYLQNGLEEVLIKYFGDFRLPEVLTNVGIPAYDIESRKHFYFQSFSPNTNHLFMYEVALAATAAPIYFPPVRLPMYPEYVPKGYVTLIDGGVFANNPALYALNTGRIVGSDPEDILLLSLGTGAVSNPIKFEETWGWGLWGWAKPLIDIVFSDPGVAEELKGLLTQDSYFRLQPKLDIQHSDLDDASSENIIALKQIARQYIDDNLSGIVFRLDLKRPPQCQNRTCLSGCFSTLPDVEVML